MHKMAQALLKRTMINAYEPRHMPQNEMLTSLVTICAWGEGLKCLISPWDWWRLWQRGQRFWFRCYFLLVLAKWLQVTYHSHWAYCNGVPHYPLGCKIYLKGDAHILWQRVAIIVTIKWESTVPFWHKESASKETDLLTGVWHIGCFLRRQPPSGSLGFQ